MHAESKYDKCIFVRELILLATAFDTVYPKLRLKEMAKLYETYLGEESTQRLEHYKGTSEEYNKVCHAHTMIGKDVISHFKRCRTVWTWLESWRNPLYL